MYLFQNIEILWIKLTKGEFERVEKYIQEYL